LLQPSSLLLTLLPHLSQTSSMMIPLRNESGRYRFAHSTAASDHTALECPNFFEFKIDHLFVGSPHFVLSLSHSRV
jgi:hypothetical protein